jgi:hypothetical protein
MDFLRDFRAGGSVTGAESDWKPSTEVVLGLHELTLTPGAPVATVEDGRASVAQEPEIGEQWVDEGPEDGLEPEDGPEPINGSAHPSFSWHSSSTGPRGHSSRTAWAGSERPGPGRPSPARPNRVGWGHSDAWSGTRTPKPVGSRRRSPASVTAALVTVLALLAAGVVYVLRQQGPHYPSAWGPRVEPVAAFVQSSRGLNWKHPVRVTFLTGTQFEAKLEALPEGLDRTGPVDQQQIEVGRAFGLEWGGVQTSISPTTVEVEALGAVYDASEKVVYVDGPTLTPFVEAALARTLTTALEGEYFNLGRLTSGSAERRLAASALVEGAADRVEQAYVGALPVAEQRLYQQEYQQETVLVQRAEATMPPSVADSSGFPNAFGLTLINALYAQGGSVEVDEAFRAPPDLDGDVVNPAAYQPGLPTPKVSAPPVPAGATKILPAQGLGEVPLVETLGYEIGFSAAWRAVAGWTGDQFVAYDYDGRTCVALSVLSDNAGDAGALAVAGSVWSHHVPGALVTESGLTVNFRSCDPGPTWRPAQAADQSYQYLSARAFFIDNFIVGWHFDADGATCVADELLAKLGPAQLLGDTALASTNSPSGRALLAAIRQAAPQCGISG